VFELDWNPDEPAEAAAALKDQLGSADAVAIAVDIGFTFVKRVELPPLPLEERRRILTLEPERYFPVRGESVVVSLRDGTDLVFAVRESVLEHWISAIEKLGPVKLLEPAPYSLARGLDHAGVRNTSVLTTHPEGGDTVLIEIRDGEVLNTRRLFGTAVDALVVLASGEWPTQELQLTESSAEMVETISTNLPGTKTSEVPHVQGCPPGYVTAYGVAMGIGTQPESGLTTAELARRWLRSSRRRLFAAVILLAAATFFLVFSVDAHRSRVSDRLEADIESLSAPGGSVLSLQAEADRLNRDLTTVSEIVKQRLDPLEVLLAVSVLLPEDAYLRTMEVTGDQWRLDGYAGDAAALIPTFEASASFEEVRFIRATNRVRLGNENYEDFSLAFRYIPEP